MACELRLRRRNSRVRTIGWGVVVASVSTVLSGCGLLTGDDRTPTTITVTPSEISFEAVGQSVSLAAEVLDQDGAVMEDAEVEWGSSAPGVAEVSAAGVVTSTGNGDSSITASIRSVVGESVVSVRQTPAQLQVAGGDGQEGAAGEALPESVSVRILDPFGSPAEGISVVFEVEAGSGATEPASVTTRADGIASTSWRLGEVAGEPQRLLVRLLDPEASGDAPPSQAQQLSGTIHAVAVPGPAHAVVKIDGDDQAAQRSTPLADDPTARVVDRFDNPVPDALVEWIATSGTADPTSSLTDTDGVVTTRWTLGPALGLQELEAHPPGATESAVFQATSIAVPAAMEPVSGSGQSGTVGEVLPIEPRVRVVDSSGSPVPFASVTFTVQSGGGSLDDPEGLPSAPASPGPPAVPTPVLTVQADQNGVASAGPWRLGTTAGSNLLSATIEGVQALLFQATGLAGPAVALDEVSGNNQSATPGATLPSSIVVRAIDQHGNPTGDAEVGFVPSPGSGTASPMQTTSLSNGLASTQWTLGSSVGGQQLTASLPGGSSVVFSATATGGGGGGGSGGYDIEYLYVDPVSPAVEAAFEEARARWSEVIVGDESDVTVNIAPGGCLGLDDTLSRTVDDLLVIVRIEPNDGPGGTLGSAGACYVRTSNGLPLLGQMRFDEADVDNLLAGGQFDEVVVHELGHVIGISGGIWGSLGLLENPTSPSTPGVEDTHFPGSAAIAAFDAGGGTAYTDGAKVPVENNEDFGPGTYNGHWRESVFDNELMTGFLDGGANPLSRITAGALDDMGYSVDPDGAEPYTLPPQALRAAPPDDDDGFWIEEEIFGPVGAIDDSGTITPIPPPPGP